MSPVSSAGMIISSANRKRAAGGDAEPHAEAGALQAAELRAGEEERGERGDEREQAGRDPARVAEGVEQRVVLEAREDELHHLPERLLDVAGVDAEEADQRGVGQRGEHEAGDEDDRERADADDPGGDDGRCLPELPELADELGLGRGAAGFLGPGSGLGGRAVWARRWLAPGRRGASGRPEAPPSPSPSSGRPAAPRRPVSGSGPSGLGSGSVRAPARAPARGLARPAGRLGRRLLRGSGGGGGASAGGPLSSRRTGRPAVRAKARAVLQPVAALVAERHPGAD